MENYPLISITIGGTIHKHFINKLINLKIPKPIIKTIKKILHQIAIKFFTYMVLNKRKVIINQTRVPPLKRKRKRKRMLG